jgi:hypothetical protein
MHCEHNRDQDTIRTENDHSTMQRTLMSLLEEISHSTTLRAAFSAMAAMASMAVRAEVINSAAIQDYGDQIIRQKDAFGPITESSLAGVCSTSGQHPQRSSGQHWHHQHLFYSITKQVNRWPAMQINIRHGSSIVYKKWAGNGPWILGTCRQTYTKSLRSPIVSPLQYTGSVIWAPSETSGGNCGHESMKSVDSSTVRTRKLG